MRRAFPLSIVLLLVVACEGREPAATPASPVTAAPPSTPAATTATTEPGGAPTTSPTPDLPPGIPPIFEDDVASANVPAAALVPVKAEVTGTWYGVSSAGEAIVVAWQMPGDDPFRLARGFALWRRFDDEGPPWRPVAGEVAPRDAGVLGITGIVADVTGDGSDDVVLKLDTGGSGACGRFLVLDLATGETIYDEAGCDRSVEPHAGPTGLLVREAVYQEDDPHCCPSTFRETVLTYAEDGAWEVDSERERPAT